MATSEIHAFVVRYFKFISLRFTHDEKRCCLIDIHIRVHEFCEWIVDHSIVGRRCSELFRSFCFAGPGERVVSCDCCVGSAQGAEFAKIVIEGQFPVCPVGIRE